MIEIIRNMPEAEYRARSEDSQSQFKAHREPTDAHALHSLKTRKTTDDMINGTCLHALILEGKKIYAVAPECDRRTTVGKSIWAKFVAEYVGMIVRSAEQGIVIEGMAAGIRRNSEAMRLLESEGETELSIFHNGTKCRIDKVTPLGPLDIKTTSDGADAWTFAKVIEKWGYAIQAAHYLDLAGAAGLPAENYWFIVVESFPPFEANVFWLSHRSLDVGRRELEELKERYYKCKETGIYLGFQHSEEIELPAYKFKEI